MSERPAPWPRPHFSPSGREVAFDLFCFSREPITLDRGSPAAEPWCPYDAMPGSLDLGVYRRDTAAQLFDHILGAGEKPPLGRVTIRSPAFVEDAKTWQHLNVVEVKLLDAADLGYLQCAWAMVRWLMRGGAAAVFDDAARNWHMAAAVLEWPAPLDFNIDRETQLVFESDTEPGRGHLMHSRGMRKFGRPDVLTELPPGQGLRWQVDEMAQLLTAMTTELALGQQLGAGRMVQMEGSVFDLEDYLPGGNLPDVKLENVGLVLKRR